MSAEEPDPLGMYLEQIGKISLLFAADEVDLAKRIEAGLYAGHLIDRGGSVCGLIDRGEARPELVHVRREGRRALDLLIRSDLRLVVAAARRYAHRELPLLDLIQEGNPGRPSAPGAHVTATARGFRHQAPVRLGGPGNENLSRNRRTSRNYQATHQATGETGVGTAQAGKSAACLGVIAIY